MRWASLIGLGLVVSLSSCSKTADSEGGSSAKASSNHPAWFEDATAAMGLDFKHDSGAAGAYFMPESIGSGGALLDFDNDGRLDLYLIHNGGRTSASKNRLFRQTPEGRFQDVSDGSGLDVSGHGMGVAVADVTNDGMPEVLLNEYGNTRLFHNQGAGKFKEVTRHAGIDNARWATAAAFFDYDRDGWLDLVVVNYVDYSETVKCYDTRGALEYCGPQGMQGTAARLFRNLGASNGGMCRFADATVTSGLARHTGAGLGVICADFDQDRWPDIFIADDGMPNRLFINQHNGTFIEEAAQRGIAHTAFGAAAANMGIAVGDVDGDRLFDVFVTHVSWEQHALWKQGPAGLFQDRTAAAGLGTMAWRGTGFGTVLGDLDHDGDLDLAFVNGRIKRADAKSQTHKETLLPRQDPFWDAYAQRNQLFANDGAGAFQDICEANPAFCGMAGVGRGLACGDIDNDGDLDLLTMNSGAPAQLLRNVAPKGGHWLVVRAIEPAHGGRDAYGAEITIQAGPREWTRLVQPGYSYLVSNDPRAHFGLGTANEVDSIRVVWPDGAEERFTGGSANRFLILSKGTGHRAQANP